MLDDLDPGRPVLVEAGRVDTTKAARVLRASEGVAMDTGDIVVKSQDMVLDRKARRAWTKGEVELSTAGVRAKGIGFKADLAGAKLVLESAVQATFERHTKGADR